jgi:hypothetical protein
MIIGTPASIPSAPVANKPAASAPAPAEQPKDKVETSSGGDSGQFAKMAITGIGGIALAIPCTYAGLAGGAVVGGLLGGAMGPVTGALSSSGMGGAITAAWHTAGTMGHLGLVIGGATALAGAFAISSKVGSVFTHDKANHAAINWKNPVNMAVGTVLVTGGLAAGAVGGLALFGGAAAATTAVSGLIHSGFHAAALNGTAHNAFLYGGIGGATAGIVGFAGAKSLTEGFARHVVDPATNLITHKN